MADYPLRWIAAGLAVGYAPRSPDDLATLKQHAISAIVNLCAECYDLHEVQLLGGFDVFHIPLADETAPEDIHLFEQGFAWVDRHLEAGHRVLVHCRYGIGRTGTFVLIYLLFKGVSLKAALKKLDPTPSRPNSRAQWDFVEAYARKRSLAGSEEIPQNTAQADRPGRFFRHIRAFKDWLD